jgi:hypothetical protein
MAVTWGKGRKVPRSAHRRLPADVVPSGAFIQAELALLKRLATDGDDREAARVVRWELEADSPTGPYKLWTCFPSGRMVQSFDTVSAALVRQSEIQEMLLVNAQRAFLNHRRCCGGTARLFTTSFN